MILLEIGNSTIKVGHVEADGAVTVERYSNVEALLRRCEASTEPILCAPVGRELAREVLERLEGRREVMTVDRERLAPFIGASYDTPETLGLDRVLNLLGLSGDGVVVSCGTAITIDALAGGRPVWGAIMPGFRTAANGLHERVPVLPVAVLRSDPVLPARSSIDSVTNGVVLGTALGALGIVERLAAAAFAGPAPRIVATGGDAELLRSLLSEVGVELDEAILFRGMAVYAKGSGVKGEG